MNDCVGGGEIQYFRFAPVSDRFGYLDALCMCADQCAGKGITHRSIVIIGNRLKNNIYYLFIIQIVSNKVNYLLTTHVSGFSRGHLFHILFNAVYAL